MIGVGFRVPSEELENLEDGQWVMISGKLVREEQNIDLPYFRFDRAMISSTNLEYYLLPEEIMSYNRIDQLPLLSELILEGERSGLFGNALIECGIMEELEEDGPYTVFLPVDQAIENMPVLLKDLSEDELVDLVSAHIVPGTYPSDELMKVETLETINGTKLEVKLINAKFRINQSRLLFMNIEARNGIIHYIYPAIREL
jgi:hypothetical protein